MILNFQNINDKSTLEKKFGFSPELSQMQILILKLATKIDAENYQAVEQLGLTYAKKQNW